MDSPCFQRAVQPSTWAVPRGDERGGGLWSCSNEAATTAKTPKAHTSCKARLHLFPVLVLFRPVIAARQTTPTDAGLRPFPAFLSWLTGKSPAPGCARCPVFILLFTGIYRQAGVNRTGLAPGLRHETRKCLRRRSLAAPAQRPQATRYSRSSRNGSAS